MFRKLFKTIYFRIAKRLTALKPNPNITPFSQRSAALSPILLWSPLPAGGQGGSWATIFLFSP